MHVDDVALGVALARPFDGTEVPDIVYQWKYGVVATGTFRGEIFTCRDSEFRESMRQSWVAVSRQRTVVDIDGM